MMARGRGGSARRLGEEIEDPPAHPVVATFPALPISQPHPTMSTADCGLMENGLYLKRSPQEDDPDNPDPDPMTRTPLILTPRITKPLGEFYGWRNVEARMDFTRISSPCFRNPTCGKAHEAIMSGRIYLTLKIDPLKRKRPV